MAKDLTGKDRCVPCTAMNLAVGLIIGGAPLAVAWSHPEPAVQWGALLWFGMVMAFTFYRLVARGYLPGAERFARATGLHDRIGPGGDED